MELSEILRIKHDNYLNLYSNVHKYVYNNTNFKIRNQILSTLWGQLKYVAKK